MHKLCEYIFFWTETIEQTDDTHVVYLIACEVGFDFDCAFTWSIPTMKCGTKNIMYLRQRGICGRFCLGKHLYIFLHSI